MIWKLVVGYVDLLDGFFQQYYTITIDKVGCQTVVM